VNNFSQNFNIDGSELPDRLQSLRKLRKWTQSDLAEKAGLSYRTIHDLELGKRKRVQEKTLLLICDALDLTLPELLILREDSQIATPKRRSPGKMLLVLVALLVVVAAVGGAQVWNYARSHSTWEIQDQQHLVVRDGLLHQKLWSLDGPHLQPAKIAPWSASILLVGHRGLSENGYRIYALNMADGDTLWSCQLDLDQMTRVLGKGALDHGNMGLSRTLHADLDGDGVPELLATFIHSNFYPSAILWIGQDGQVRGQYTNHGHLLNMVAEDFNHDGKDEVIVGGTTNVRAYNGASAVILDEDHFSGGSVDSIAHPESPESDGSLLRLVIPNLPSPAMKPFISQRIFVSSGQFSYDNPDTTRILLNISCDNLRIGILTVDPDGSLVDFHYTDTFMEHLGSYFPDGSEIYESGPGHAAWDREWLGRIRRYGALSLPEDNLETAKP